MPAWRVLHLQVQRARAMIEYQSTFWAPILYRCSPAAEHAMRFVRCIVCHATLTPSNAQPPRPRAG